MVTASGEREGTRRLTMAVVAYAFVLALIGLAGIVFWTWVRAGAAGTLERAGAPPVISTTVQAKPMPGGPGLSLPPRPAKAAAALPAGADPAAQEPAMPSLQAEASPKEPLILMARAPAPPSTACAVDIGPWPADRTGQVKAIQTLLRDLGFYGGTTYGTMGPATRAAIAKFQLASSEAETGEPSEMLFEALKKRCASPAP